MNKENLKQIIKNIPDTFGDFFITKSNLRLAISENIETVIADIEKGNKLFIEEKGIAIIIGYADNNFRKYVKLLALNNTVADKLLKNIDKEIKEELFVKIKKMNPLKAVFLNNNYKFYGDRGREILLKKKGRTE